MYYIVTKSLNGDIEVGSYESYDAAPLVTMSIDVAKAIALDIIKAIYPTLRFDIEKLVGPSDDEGDTDELHDAGRRLTLDDIVRTSLAVKITTEYDGDIDATDEFIRRIDEMRRSSTERREK